MKDANSISKSIIEKNERKTNFEFSKLYFILAIITFALLSLFALQIMGISLINGNYLIGGLVFMLAIHLLIQLNEQLIFTAY